MGLHDRDYMREPERRPWDFLRWLTALHWIVWANVIVFILQFIFQAGVRTVTDESGYEQTIPLGGVSVDGLAQGRFWTAITYMFVHSGPLHLVANMFMVWFAGKRVMALLGQRHFLNIYFLSGLVGAAAELMVRAYAEGDTQIPIVGASACAFGLVLALAVMFPEEQITALIYFVLPVRARLWTMAMVMVAVTAAMGLFFLFFFNDSRGAQMANFAHLGGAFMGWYYMRLIGYGGGAMSSERLWRERDPRSLARRPEVVRARRRRLAENIDMEAAADKTASPPDLIREEVDPILDKISEQGIASLTEEERRILERASREIGRNKPGF